MFKISYVLVIDFWNSLYKQIINGNYITTHIFIKKIAKVFVNNSKIKVKKK